MKTHSRDDERVQIAKWENCIFFLIQGGTSVQANWQNRHSYCSTRLKLLVTCVSTLDSLPMHNLPMFCTSESVVCIDVPVQYRD